MRDINKIIDIRVDELEKENEKLKTQLKEAEKVVDEVISRSIYTYTNTQCESAKERVVKIAKLGEEYRTKYTKEWNQLLIKELKSSVLII